LLLDEATAHLDTDRRAALVAAVRRLRSQVVLTGTDEGLYEGLGDETSWFVVAGDAIRLSIGYGRSGQLGV